MSDLQGGGPGALFAIGGAEDKLKRRTVLQEFVESAGGSKARIVVVPTASALGPDVVDVYHALFAALGAASVVGVRPENREDADDPAFLEPLEDATGIFMTGGNQLKLAGVVTGTAFGRAVTAAHDRGATVGGTSAGASILAEHMIAFGRSGATPRQRMSQLSGGLGLVQGAIVDQHFAQRNRYGRLLSLVAQSPGLLGIGVDEDTAAVVRGTHLEVVGRGAVTIFDGSRIASNAHYAKRSEPILASGVVLHVLPATATFDLEARVLLSYGPQPPAEEIAELEAAEADLQKLAREIAAEGVSPKYYADRKRRAGRRTAQAESSKRAAGRSSAAGESRPEATEPITAGADLDDPSDRMPPSE
ncbi:cyanophycinase [Kribbella capetownensis]|uniref:Cyanophycinase n=1 Tax=Kribbella capetownensis TaxID=1572659 RepID=A0A4R0JT37_9ACTN|nr:cyanophycinase [Kribbella capetownensis]TCC49717.1 cyanophycinase [Kribbella capetownensis]